ncbi:MAG TPA: hypothetical protein VGD07_19990 [Methylomirabilota bacterium]|jgi:hypothetical protein
MKATRPGWAIKTDRVRAIDRFIDYFGESRTAALALLGGAVGISPWRGARVKVAVAPWRPAARARR